MTQQYTNLDDLYGKRREEVNGMLFHSSSLQMIKNQKSFEDFTVSLFRSKDCSLNIAFSGKRKPEWGEAQGLEYTSAKLNFSDKP